MNSSKLSRRKLFAGALAGALLHVLKPLRAVELAPVEAPIEAVLNPDYVNAEFECYFWCDKSAYETLNINPERVVPVVFKRGSGFEPENQPSYPLRFNLSASGEFILVPPTV